jgi:hypothetical protein
MEEKKQGTLEELREAFEVELLTSPSLEMRY